MRKWVIYGLDKYKVEMKRLRWSSFNIIMIKVCILENGEVIKGKVMGFIFWMMVLRYIKVSGLLIRGMERVLKYYKLEIIMRVSGKMIYMKEMES